MATVPMNYNPEVSLLPAGTGELTAMRGGGLGDGLVGGNSNNESVISGLTNPSIASSSNNTEISNITNNTAPESLLNVTTVQSMNSNNGANEFNNEPVLFLDTNLPIALQNALLEVIGAVNAMDINTVKEKFAEKILELLQNKNIAASEEIEIKVFASEGAHGGKRKLRKTRRQRQLRKASTPAKTLRR